MERIYLDHAYHNADGSAYCGQDDALLYRDIWQSL